ncbi:MFS transporter [Sphingobium sp. SCG-1]|uniref:MFS transporter n=1 Tax=Sphingobium sp. SCG-1 TaxID=2072936 RepID=UPI000CD6C5A9|nr:MFS transporter [Sphingobium sp. SCG-1]AUW59551.1 MFS transporter [Sphingobium sp. SCG-1]
MTAKQQYAAPSEILDGIPTPRRYYAAAAVWLAISMSVLDSAIANIALPTIAAELHAPPAVTIWVINAYQLAITILLLPLAAMGDRIGHARVYLPGLGLFILGSLACALAQSLPWLIAARMFQGVGAAGIMSMNAALVRAIYPSAMLGRGMGYNALVLSISAAIGPTLASLILAVATWPWLFAVNVPIGLAALIVGYRCLPRVKGHGRKPDYLSALLSAGMLALIVFGAESFAREGSYRGLALLLLGIVIGAVLIHREWRKPAPLFPLDLLRIPVFSLSIVTSLTSFTAQMLAFVTMPFLLQSVLGLSIVQSGLLMTPWPIAAGCTAAWAGRLADRYPAGLLGGAGLTLLAIGLYALSSLEQHPSTLDIIWRMALCGAGFGLFQSPNNRAMVNAAPRSRSGAAGGMLATARLLGQTSGAVAVASGFHWLGLNASPTLLMGASVAAALAACISMLRLRLPTNHLPSGHPVIDLPGSGGGAFIGKTCFIAGITSVGGPEKPAEMLRCHPAHLLRSPPPLAGTQTLSSSCFKASD